MKLKHFIKGQVSALSLFLLFLLLLVFKHCWHLLRFGDRRQHVCVRPYQLSLSLPGGGGGLVFQGGYHPRKKGFKTHPKHVFFRYENDPKYASLHAFFLICTSRPFQNLSI